VDADDEAHYLLARAVKVVVGRRTIIGVPMRHLPVPVLVSMDDGPDESRVATFAGTAAPDATSAQQPATAGGAAP